MVVVKERISLNVAKLLLDIAVHASFDVQRSNVMLTKCRENK